jgi:hypothetical protein
MDKSGGITFLEPRTRPVRFLPITAKLQNGIIAILARITMTRAANRKATAAMAEDPEFKAQEETKFKLRMRVDRVDLGEAKQGVKGVAFEWLPLASPA